MSALKTHKIKEIFKYYKKCKNHIIYFYDSLTITMKNLQIKIIYKIFNDDGSK